MTAVWQTLIPETPSTEPIASSLEGNTPPSPETTGNTNESGAIGVSTICGSSASENIHHRLLNHNNNNNHPHLLLKKSSSRTSASCKRETGFRRFTSVPCGEHLWRFYSDRLQTKKKHDNRRRILLKSGLRNLCQINVDEKPRRYWSDMFTTLVDARWRYTLFIFSLSYVLSWLGFALVWWVILVAHDDIRNFGKNGWKPCVDGVQSFASVFLFSLETQHTIGYGFHRMTSECPDAIVVLCLQSIAGVLIEALMVGVVFAKLSRPKKRSETLVFSRQAVICQRDGQLYLMFRVGDIRKSHILEAHVRAQVITKRTTIEGEVMPIHQEEIKVGGYGEDEDRILLFWPTTVVHPIDSDSPLYEMSASDLMKAKLEVMVIMEGVVESTGMTTQARTSYLPSEILWGHRFHNTTSYKSDSGHHLVDFDLFHATFPVETPLCSASDLDRIRQLKSEGLTGREILASLTETTGFKIENGPSPPNGACCNLVKTSDAATPRLQKNHVMREAIMMSTPSSISKAYNLGRRSSCVNPNLPNIPRSGLSSPIKKAGIGTAGAEFLDNSTDSDNDYMEDDEEDGDDGYVEHSTKKSNHRASRKESREAMLRAHSNSSSSITSESNV